MKYIMAILLFGVINLYSWDYTYPVFRDYSKLVKNKQIQAANKTHKIEIYKTDNDKFKNKKYIEETYDEFGNCKTKKYFNEYGGVISRIENEVGTKGQIIKTEVYDLDSKITHVINIRYDYLDRPSVFTRISVDQELTWGLEYDDSRYGILIRGFENEKIFTEEVHNFEGEYFVTPLKRIRFTELTIIKAGHNYKYDDNKNLIEETYFNNETDEQYRIAYEYNDQNQQISETKFDSGNNVIYKIKKDYNFKGLLYKESKTDVEGNLIYSLEYRYS